MCFYFPTKPSFLQAITSCPTSRQSQPRYLSARDTGRSRAFSNPGRHPRPAVRMVYPAMAIPSPICRSASTRSGRHHAERTQLIIEALQGKEKTAFEVSGVIFGTELPEFDQFLALNETYVHIVELMDKGSVTAGERDGLVLYRTV